MPCCLDGVPAQGWAPSARCILRAVHPGRLPTAKPHLQTNPGKTQQTFMQSLKVCKHGSSKFHISGTKTSAQRQAPRARAAAFQPTCSSLPAPARKQTKGKSVCRYQHAIQIARLKLTVFKVCLKYNKQSLVARCSLKIICLHHNTPLGNRCCNRIPC